MNTTKLAWALAGMMVAGAAHAQVVPPGEADGWRFTPATQQDDFALQLGYLLPRTPALVQDLRQAARLGLPTWRSRQMDLRDLLSGTSGGGVWGRLHGEFGEREFALGDLNTEDDPYLDRDFYMNLATAQLADWVDDRISDDVTDPVERHALIDDALKEARTLDHDTSHYGFNVGFDLIRGKAETGNWLLGATVGYLRSRSEFNALRQWSASGQIDSDTANVGLYGSFISGGFYLDAAFSSAWHSTDLDLPLLGLRPAGAMLGADANSLSGQLDLGWRPELGEGRFYVEPLAGMIWVRTDLDDVNVQPADALALGSQGSRLSFGNQESLRGHIGVRIGTAMWSVGSLKLKGELGWRTWREFRGDTEVTLGLRGTWLDLNDPGAVAQAGFYDLPPAQARYADGGTQLSLGLGLSSADGRVSTYLSLARNDSGRDESDAVTLGFRFQW